MCQCENQGQVSSHWSQRGRLLFFIFLLTLPACGLWNPRAPHAFIRDFIQRILDLRGSVGWYYSLTQTEGEIHRFWRHWILAFVQTLQSHSRFGHICLVWFSSIGRNPKERNPFLWLQNCKMRQKSRAEGAHPNWGEISLILFQWWVVTFFLMEI